MMLQCCEFSIAHPDSGQVPRDIQRRTDGDKGIDTPELKNTEHSSISFLFCLFLSGSTKSTALMAESVFYLDVS